MSPRNTTMNSEGGTKIESQQDQNENEGTSKHKRHSSGSPSSSSSSSSPTPLKCPEVLEQAPVPPDGGWGWVVAFSSFMVGVIVDGICFTFGFFFEEFMNHFGSNKSLTSSISSVLNGSYMIVGPIIGGLVNVFGCRKVAIFGSFLASVAFFLSTFSPSVEVMIVLYGFVGGVGFGCMYLPAIVMVGYYFDKKRALATGIAVCGSGIGSFVFSPLCEILLEKYGWKGSLWVISALVLNGAVFASLYRPLEFKRVLPPRSQDCSATIAEDIKKDYKECNGSEMQNKVHQDIKTIQMEIVDENGKTVPVSQATMELLQQGSLNPLYRCKSLEVNLSSDAPNHEGLARLAHSQVIGPTYVSRHHNDVYKHNHRRALNPMDRKDIFYGGSVTHFPEYKEARSAEQYVRSMLSVAVSSRSDINEVGRESLCRSLFSANVLKGVFDFSLLRRPSFVIYCISCFLCMMGFFVPFTYIPALANDLGMTVRQGTWLISTIGILNTGGRVLVGYVSDKSWSDSLLINNLCLVVGGVFTMFVPFYSVYWLLVVYAVVFGTAIAAFVSLRSIIIVELLGVERLTSSFGLVVLCQGLSSFIGSPIAGALSDHTGDYRASFYLAGATIALSGIICLPLRRISAWEKRRHIRASKADVGEDITIPMLVGPPEPEKEGSQDRGADGV